MNLQNLRTISTIIPKAEIDLPVVIYESLGYSIGEIIAEVEAGTALGTILQELPIMDLSIELAKARLIAQFSKHPELEFATYKFNGPITYTAGQLIIEIENETEIGMQWINSQLRRMEKIKVGWL